MRRQHRSGAPPARRGVGPRIDLTGIGLEVEAPNVTPIRTAARVSQLSSTAAMSAASRGNPATSPATGDGSDSPMPRRSNSTTREQTPNRLIRCSSAGSSQITSRWLVSGDTKTMVIGPSPTTE